MKGLVPGTGIEVAATAKGAACEEPPASARLSGAQRAPLPPETKQAALERIHHGDCVAQIARDLGLNRGMVQYWKCKAGLQRRIRGGHPDHVREAAVERVRNGASATQVAKDLGMTAQTVQGWCKQLGVHARGAKYPPEVKAEALRLVDELGTAAAASAALGLPAATVVSWCEQEHKALEQTSLQSRRVRLLEPEIIELLDRLPGAEIARQKGISRDAVAAVAARHGKKLLGPQPAPIVIRDLAELARRATEIRALAANSKRTSEAKRAHQRFYQTWCDRHGMLATSEEAFAAFLLDKLRNGISGRPADRGKPTGCTAGTIGQYYSHVSELLAAAGHPDSDQWPLVRRAMQIAKRRSTARVVVACSRRSSRSWLRYRRPDRVTACCWPVLPWPSVHPRR